jgi:hypothetical protein
MILVGNQRGGAKNLALHLLKEENEHVEVHEIRGFASQNLMSALNEAQAISRATRCKQYLFSLSLNPPPNENVPIEDFEVAIERVEERLGLNGQPRAIVFHEKEGRRHCHAVWSRIDAEELKAVPLPFTKRKLQEIARDLYLEHGWTMPRGLAATQESDPRNFTLAEWQQAKRTGNDPRLIKAVFQDAWAMSDSKEAFINALAERGFKTAKGDRRGFVALDRHGEIFAIAKWAGIKTKQVRDRLGDENALPNVEEVKKKIAEEMLPVINRLDNKLDDQRQERQTQFEKRKQELITRQRVERRTLEETQEKRQTEERKTRQQRFRTGIRGIWDRLSGEHKRIRKLNEREAFEAFARDQSEKEEFIFRHLEQRRRLNALRIQDRNEYQLEKEELRQDIQKYKGMLSELREQRLEEYSRERESRNESHEPKNRGRGRSLDR